MTPIQTNKPVFFNTEGEPLNGKIYIGQPGQDPRTNPKTVTLRDAGGAEFTAQQPLVTNNGRIVYNGKPIVALVDGAYSILVFDNAGAQVDYTRSVTPAEGGATDASFSELIRVGLTLEDVKAFDVSVGDVVRNVGLNSATDGQGSDWLAVSSTGAPADDDTLIDFDNGLQGRKYSTLDYQISAEIELGGDFSLGEKIIVERVGRHVTLSSATGLISHTSSIAPESTVGVLPEWARPVTGVQVRNCYTNVGVIGSVRVKQDGTVNLFYTDYSGIGSYRTDSVEGFSITYLVA